MQIPKHPPLTQNKKPKLLPKYIIANIKLANLPFQKPRDFSLRSAPSMQEYNPLKDRYLQQFFRRQTRVKLLDIYSTQVSVDSQTVIERIKTEAKDRSKSSYQNLMKKDDFITKKCLDSKRKQIQIANSSLQQLLQEKTMVTEHQGTNTKRNNSVHISKEQFRNFLQKARQRLKISPQTKI